MSANNRRFLLAAVATSAVLSFPQAGDASVARAVEFNEKVDNAAVIVVGRCTKAEARWDAQKRQILTYATFKVDKALKGQASEITVATPGGTVDGIHQETIGSPIFEPGDEQLLFVANSSIGPTVLYLAQGAYDVVRMDTQRGIAVAPEQPRTLDQLEREVRTRIAARRTEMAALQQKQAQPSASLMDVLARNKALVMLAMVGAALATWQLMKQR
jgi:hypothetical protein